MALFQKSVERRERIEPRLVAPERRASDPSWGAVSAGAGVYGAGGSFIEPHLAETLGAVVAAVELIAGSIASLPAYILDADGTMRRRPCRRCACCGSPTAA
ncbi:phage portal protein BeeE [Endobacter medicaginis]|jgi:phage portal protein BeeE|uniref:Phage portal protein BeeE n=1 Tax=Endobacter medicaginis TaxID=1181271 RepID=A0A850NLB9_9PROT|nr:hypothetical protein [Endobacter medicaginis]MBB3175574.1 phage portal protein BeeE [Endobacter medicaginis]MCX5477214.1 hypothetical protein [Endobacter medicaginis]NVN30601.1 hypothetical protein [Endobacter medicaginis]